VRRTRGGFSWIGKPQCGVVTPLPRREIVARKNCAKSSVSMRGGNVAQRYFTVDRKLY